MGDGKQSTLAVLINVWIFQQNSLDIQALSIQMPDWLDNIQVINREAAESQMRCGQHAKQRKRLVPVDEYTGEQQKHG